MKTMLSSLFALMLAAPVAKAGGEAVTFSLNTSSYFVGDKLVAGNPYFVDGQRGSFVVLEGFSTSASFSINEELPEGYQVSKWVLSTKMAGGGSTVQTWGSSSSITVTFDYKWAKKYGTYLELTVYLKPMTYTLSYDPKGGSWTAGEPEGGTYGYSDVVVAPDASAVERENYTLKGWKASGGSLIAPGAEFTGADLGRVSSTVKLYAQWSSETFKVTLNPEGGTVDKPLTEYEYGVGATLPKATKKGCKFLGWWDNPTFTGTSITKITTTDRGDKEFWAQYEASSYKVTLHANGGVVDKPLTEYEAGVGATLPKATKKGSEFLGWWDNPTFTGTNVTKIAATDRGDKEFWAQFSSGIHYNGNGATDGTMADSAYAAGVPKALTKNAFSRVFKVTYDANGGTMEAKEDTAAYSFKNWNSEPSGQGAYTYNDGQDVVNPCGVTSGPVTLYAQWQPESVSVTLPAKPKAPAGDPEFAGWFTAQSGGVRVGGAGDRYAPTWNTRLYAHWGSAKKNYTVKFSPGAEVTNPEAVEDVDGTEGKSVDVPACTYKNLASLGSGQWYWKDAPYTSATINPTILNDGEQVLLRAHWDKGSGPLSKAVGLEDVAALTNQTTAGYVWEVSSEGAREESPFPDGECVKHSTDPYATHGPNMTMLVEGAGTLKFWYKGVNIDDVASLKLRIDKPTYPTWLTTTEEYQSYEIDIDGDDIHTITWESTKGSKKVGAFYIDDVTWEPTKPEKCDITTSVSPSAGGNVSGGKEEVKPGTWVTLTATANSGYTFQYWSDGSKENPRVIEAVCDEEYQAIFSGGGSSSKNYYILFDGNGADNMSAMDGQAMPCGGSAALTVNKFARSGFAFKGWATSRYGAVAYADRATVTDVPASTPNTTKTFYAVWEASSTPTVLVTITGAKIEKKYTGSTINVRTSYSFASSEKGYTADDVKFVGPSTVSGKEVGTYAMGLSSDDFINLNEEYDVTFAVTDGSLVITKDDPGPGPGPEPTGDYESTVGVAVVVDLASDYPDLKSVSGLPSGLKYNAKTGLVTGTPTRAYDEKAVTLKFTDKSTDKIYWTVEALPEMMIGTYNGAAAVCDDTVGQFQLKLAKTGKVTGSFYASGKKISFKATTLVEEDGESFGALITYKYNRATYEDYLLLRPAGYCEVVPLWEASLGETSEVLNDIRDARRDVIKEVYGKLKAASFSVDDPELEMGEYLTAKVSNKGVVKVSGKLYSEGGKLTSVSSSSQLTVAEDGSLSCWITIYKKVGKETPIQYVYEWTMPEEN